jgi:hypothetical protein
VGRIGGADEAPALAGLAAASVGTPRARATCRRAHPSLWQSARGGHADDARAVSRQRRWVRPARADCGAGGAAGTAAPAADSLSSDRSSPSSPGFRTHAGSGAGPSRISRRSAASDLWTTEVCSLMLIQPDYHSASGLRGGTASRLSHAAMKRQPQSRMQVRATDAGLSVSAECAQSLQPKP